MGGIVLAAVSVAEDAELRSECNTSSKLADYRALRGTDRIPAYIEARVPWFLEKGRRLKTQLRLGTNMLQIEQGRYSKTPRSMRLCPLCNREVESSFHFTMVCATLQPIRQEFFALIDEIVRGCDAFGWSRMNLVSRWKFILGDGVPSTHAHFDQWHRIEHKVYSFLLKAKWARLDGCNT